MDAVAKVNWLNLELKRYKQTVRQLIDKAKKNKSANMEYVPWCSQIPRKEIVECIKKVPEISRLYKILTSNPAPKLTAIKLPDGRFARNREEFLKHFVEAHFPDFSWQEENNQFFWVQELKASVENCFPLESKMSHWFL